MLLNYVKISHRTQPPTITAPKTTFTDQKKLSFTGNMAGFETRAQVAARGGRMVTASGARLPMVSPVATKRGDAGTELEGEAPQATALAPAQSAKGLRALRKPSSRAVARRSSKKLDHYVRARFEAFVASFHTAFATKNIHVSFLKSQSQMFFLCARATQTPRCSMDPFESALPCLEFTHPHPHPHPHPLSLGPWTRQSTSSRGCMAESTGSSESS